MTNANNDFRILMSYIQPGKIVPLLLAKVEDGSTDDIEDLLKNVSQMNIHAKDEFGHTTLHSALIHPPGNLNLINIILKRGASVNEKTLGGETPLHLSLKHEMCLEVIKALLCYGADSNAKNAYDETPLEITLNSRHDNLDIIIKELLTNGANIDERNVVGQTPLHIAIEKQKSLNVIQELLKFGVEVNARNNEDFSPLDLALNNSWRPLMVIRELLNYGAFVNERTTKNQTLLHKAIDCEMNLDVINELLKFGADVDAIDYYGETPLFTSLRTFSDNLDVVKTLFHYGASVNKRNSSGETPLFVAIEKAKSLEIVKELLKQGAEVNVRDLPSDLPYETPLRLAISGNSKINFRIIQELLIHGASVHEKRNSMSVKLYIQDKENNLDVVQELLKYALIEFEHSNFEECSLCSTLFSKWPYVKKYEIEIDKMRKLYVLNQFTLYDILVRKFEYDDLYELGKREFGELSKFSDFPELMQKEYPLYFDIILNIIETRSYLLRKLCECSYFIVTNLPNHKIIKLNTDCLTEICKYLSRNDLRNFIKAISL